MNMDSYSVYRHYLALRLHFTTDTYDVIQQCGRVRASKQAFYKRKDLLAMNRVAESYSDKEVVDFLVANFVSGDRWGGVFDLDAKDRYTGWKKRIESLAYTFQNEVGGLALQCEKNNVPFESCFLSAKNQHPYIIKKYLRNDVSIETMVILNKLIDFVPSLDKSLSGDLVWPDVSRIIKKYSPFLSINKEKYDRLLRRAIGTDGE
jgi:hypothetical protein